MYHHFKASYRCPDHHNKTWLEDMKCEKYCHHKSTKHYEDSLSNTCIHSRKCDITTIIYFLQKEKKCCKEAWSSEKDSDSHKRESKSWIKLRIQIKKQESCRSTTRKKDNKQDEKIWLQAHKIWQKVRNRIR